MKRIPILAAALLLAASSLCLRAQSANQPAAHAPEHFYQLKLVVEELDSAGRIINSRTYQTTVSTNPKSPAQTLKTGSRVPVATGSYAATHADVQFQYIDLGVDARIEHTEEAGNDLEFRLRMEVSSMAAQSETIAGVNEPVIRQNTWDSDVVVPVGKPTVVFSSDDLDSKGKMQVQVTATPVQ
jgi:hypothetical protein